MTYPRKMLLDVTPQRSVFFASFDPTLHSSYTMLWVQVRRAR